MAKKSTFTLILLWLLLTACSAPTPTPLPPLVAPTPVQAPDSKNKTAIFEIDSANTTATYTVDETLFNENNRLNTAIGKTSKIAGQMILNYNDPTQSAFGTFLVDISMLKSDSGNRDEMIRKQFLESAKFPLATFTVKRVENFPANPKEGQTLQFNLIGDMLVKQTTREVKWEVVAVLNGNKLVGKAKTFVFMKDFNFDPPSILFQLAVKDGVTVALDFTFVKK